MEPAPSQASRKTATHAPSVNTKILNTLNEYRHKITDLDQIEPAQPQASRQTATRAPSVDTINEMLNDLNAHRHEITDLGTHPGGVLTEAEKAAKLYVLIIDLDDETKVQEESDAQPFEQTAELSWTIGGHIYTLITLPEEHVSQLASTCEMIVGVEHGPALAHVLKEFRQKVKQRIKSKEETNLITSTSWSRSNQRIRTLAVDIKTQNTRKFTDVRASAPHRDIPKNLHVEYSENSDITVHAVK